MTPEQSSKSRRVSKITPLATAMLAAGAIFSACDEKDKGKVSPQPKLTSNPTIETIDQTKGVTYIWSQDQLATNQNDFPVEKLIFTQHQTPPYYDGPQPLTFARFREMQFSTSSIEIIYADEFENFTNFYVYEGIFLIGVQTYQNNAVVAEARLEYFPEDEMLRPEKVILGEVQYDSSGKISFTAKSEIDFITSLKVKELESEGQRKDEYYFLVPLQ